jgi:hypothetical protein
MKIRFDHTARICVLVTVTALVFLTSSCGPCLICPGGGATDTGPIQKRQEELAKLEKPNGNKTGMIFGFSASNNEKPVTAQPAEPSPYTDLSMHYVLPSDNCPFNTESVHMAFSAGPNINFKSSGDDVYEGGSHKPGIGFQAGFRSTFRFTEKFSVVPGLFFKQNNASEEATFSDGGDGSPYTYSVADKYSYGYLSAPILAQYNLSNAFSISAGPEVNYLLKSKVNSEMTMMGETEETKEDLTKNSVKLGLGVQVGVKYQIPDSRVAIQLTYDHRLSRLNKKPGSYYETSAWRMKSVQLGVTVRTCDLFNKKDHKGVID